MTAWLSRQTVLGLQDELLARYGGATGMRDDGLLESALARPLNRASYGDPDIVELAALYALAIARNHPFVDGNKRTAFAAMALFLRLNGLELQAAEAEAVMVVLKMAAHAIDDDDFTAWVGLHVEPI
ncbi:MAG TPA: type II toxin-antitoxin system death-on-curing family toxin [Acetobacteraceae bacterium]